jgi:hypothetical protein
MDLIGDDVKTKNRGNRVSKGLIRELQPFSPSELPLETGNFFPQAATASEK